MPLLEFCRLSKGRPLLSKAEPEVEELLGSAAGVDGGGGGSFKGLMPSSGISSSPVI